MKPHYIASAFVVFLLLNSYGLQAQTTQTQHKPVCLDNTEQFSIKSKYVAGENYIIQVGLPIGYVPSKKSYPVLYVLDGDKSFGMTKEIADWQMWSQEIKDIIVVGISYGQGMDAWWQKRARDYSHCADTINVKWVKEAGGADNFLKFVKNELFPVINQNYKTNQDSIAIMGLSLGGMLGTYILFKQPELFKGYIIIAPGLGWNNNSILKMEDEFYKNHKELNKLLYMAYGSLDNNKVLVVNPSKDFMQTIQKRNYAGLKFVPEVLEGETHISVYATALTHGLKTIFKR
jgi:predicted alpha/beta superfamily hydrolase